MGILPADIDVGSRAEGFGMATCLKYILPRSGSTGLPGCAGAEFCAGERSDAAAWAAVFRPFAVVIEEKLY